MAGFYPYRTLRGDTTGATKDFLIENSATITLGDDVDVTAGYAGLTGASARSMGIVIGFYRDLGNGQKISLSANAAGTLSTGVRSGNQGVTGSDTFVAGSDNVTIDKVGVTVVIDPEMEYYNDANATAALTAAKVGTYFNNVSASDQIDSNTSAVFDESDATEQWILLEINPHNDGDTSKGIFKKVKSQLVG
jgi:hypothetical protein